MTPEERADLISRYLDENLQEGDEALLEKLLTADPGFARELADLSMQHGLLYRLGRTGPASALDASEESLERRSRSRWRIRASRGKAGGPSWAWVAAAAAGIIVGAAVLHALRPAPPAAAPHAVRTEPAPPPPPDPPPQPLPAPRPPETPREPAPAPGRDPAPAPPPTEEPKPQPPVISVPTPPPPRERETPGTTTVSVFATVERAEGPVIVLDGPAERPGVRAGATLGSGQGLRTGPRASVAVKYPDGTRLELGPETLVRELAQRPGKHVTVARGTIVADVTKQPQGQPFVVSSPNGEVTVLGTRFALTAATEYTRVDVREGKVRLSGEKASVEISAGQHATAAAGASIASRPLRAAPGLLAFYAFAEGRGPIIHDTARTELPPLDLRIEDEAAVRWLPGALAFQSPTFAASLRPAERISEACRKSNELTVEAWVRPARTTPIHPPDPGRIVTLSSDHYTRNFTLEQGEPNSTNPACFSFRLRTNQTNANGWPPPFKTPNNSAETRLTHVLYARAADGAAVFYLNGTEAGRGTSRGNLSTWDDRFHLVLGDEIVGQRAWTGEFHAVAVFSRALAADEVRQRFRAGAE